MSRISTGGRTLRMAALAALLGAGAASAQDAGTLPGQLNACLQAVLAMDAAPFDTLEAAFALDGEREGIVDARRMFEPESGAAEIHFARGPLYYDTETLEGADCHIWVPADDTAALAEIEAFRAEVAAQFGPFEAVETGIEGRREVMACPSGRPLRLIDYEETVRGQTMARLSFWNSTSEGITC